MKFDKGYFGKAVKEMSDKEICRHYHELADSVDRIGCFGSKDVKALTIIETEINRRGIQIIEGKNDNADLPFEYSFENKNGEDIGI